LIAADAAAITGRVRWERAAMERLPIIRIFVASPSDVGEAGDRRRVTARSPRPDRVAARSRVRRGA